MEELSRCLAAGSLLIHSEKGGDAPNLRAVLLTRLAQCRAQRGLPERVCGAMSLEQAQEETAQEALSVVESVQRILDQDERTHPAPNDPLRSNEDSPDEMPLIGTRDISQLRTLLSIVFKWGTEPLLARINVVWPERSSTHAQPRSKILEMNDAPRSYVKLTIMIRQFLSLIFPRGVHGTIPQTLITSTILNRHATDILRPGITLGWVPKSLSTESFSVVDDLRPFIMRLMSMLPPSQNIASLGAIMSLSPPPPQHVHKSCASLLSRQLMRPDGVRGLFEAVFGDGVSEEAPLEKLLHVAQVLGAVPSAVTAEEYFRFVVPRLTDILSPRAKPPPAFIRAASFTLSRMITAEDTSRHHALVSNILLSLLHGAILLSSPASVSVMIPATLTPVEAVKIIQAFLTNTDPAPSLLSTVLSPIATSLYVLLGALARVKATDPALRESVRGLLLTWGRVVPVDEAVAILWTCIDGQGGDWTVDIAGNEQDTALAFFTPDDLKKAEESGAFDIDANYLGLRPDPVHFVGISEGYQDFNAGDGSDPLRTLLFLQLIIQVQTQMSKDGPSPSDNILNRPEHILSFVKHALQSVPIQDSTSKQASEGSSPRHGLTMDDLRIVRDEVQNDTEGDSDDETSGVQGARPNDEMTETGLNLLLSVLEVNPTLSFAAPSESVRALAREARMALTVRLASASTTSPGRAPEPEEDRIRSTYQRALKLLQDALLPVRAHGLLLLRELVVVRAGTTPHEAVRALEPAIRDVFLQAVQDEDSYIFLNAVQGLSTLADSFGADVMRALVRIYADGLQGVGAGALTRQEVDMRLRIGEALGQVIRRCGDTLPRYCQQSFPDRWEQSCLPLRVPADHLIPPLFALVRGGGGSHLPTTLRTSSLSLLATIADTADVALLPYAHDLANAMLDLLQIEGAQAHARGGQPSPAPSSLPASMDSHPTAADATFPPFRRASLHFLGVLVRAYTRRAYSSRSSANDEFPLRRATVTLGYVAATDADSVVRVMAREVAEALQTLDRALVGF
ncbi:hypothetical protein F5148DRAFT_1348955 [Russula earlei]|uniref:Uncharacterized protein n=1 Tax=Russula earlei TaxID=71964 RepID=A0ACC0UBN9_9AGAM|nr:hypothetical protein F5148DRAFT_1348955 [Russula earlei]